MSAEDSAATPLRVVVLADYGGSYAGTFISMLIAIVRESRKRGCVAEVIFSSAARERTWLEELQQESVPYRFAPDAPVNLRRWLTEEVIGDCGPIVLHTHFTKFDIPAALASRGRSNVFVFWHIHSPASGKLVVRLRNVLKYALVGRLVKRIFCVAPDIANDVRRRGASAERAVFMPNAIDTARFPRTRPDERVSARQHFGLPLDLTILLHFGWAWERKGGEIFVQTVSMLQREGLAVLGLSVGGGESARSSVAAMKLNDKVLVLEPLSDVRTLYAAADQFFSPSLAEGMPFAMTEALSTGLAVVGSAIPGQIAIARGIEACRLTGPDPASLANAVRETIARDADRVIAESEAAHAEIVRSFDLVPWAKRVVDYYLKP